MNVRLKKFVSYYRPYVWLFLGDMGCALIVSLVALALPLCIRYLTNNVLAANAPHALNQILAMAGVMLALVAIYALCNTFVDYQGHVMGALMESDMRRELFDHYQKLSFTFYDEQRTGQLMSRITNDLFSLSEFYHHGPEDLAIALLTIGGVFVILTAINVQLALLIILFVPVMGVYAFYFNRKMNAAVSKSKARIGDINAQVEDSLSGIRVVKSFANEAIEAQKFAGANQRFVESRKAGYRSESLFSNGMIALTHLITIAVVIVGGINIVNATLNVADLLTFLLYVGILVEPIMRLVNFARLYQEALTGFSRFMEMLEIEPDDHDSAGARELADVQGCIEFQHVSFKYREEQDYVLRDICLRIKPGEYVALVGASGGGKTTLCSLIPRFYTASAGAVLLDGHDVRQVSRRSLRRSVGVVHQDVYLFAGTVADNIRYGKPEASLDEIIAAARKANAHDFIMRLPAGYDTDIGQHGVKLSGGQKQRISIARVFLKDPPVIIFDEATSALDNESEQAVQDSLERLANSRTTLVIAHRLSTVRNAQRIVVLTGNGIDEQGTHAQLLALNGAYAAFYNLQT